MTKGRRGNKEGLIRKRIDGRWEARVSLDDGKTKSFYSSTRQEVAQRLNEALIEQREGTLVLDDRQTIGQYLEGWLETVSYQIRPSTWRRYKNFTQLHIIPILGKTALSKVTAQQVQLFYNRKVREGLSTTTVNHIHGMFHRALEDAVKLGVIHRNITEMVKPPRRSYREMTTLSPEQVRKFLVSVQGDPFEAVYMLALTTGMREGEIFALRWQDVDFTKKLVHVRLGVQEDGSKFILAEPKTKYSKRKIGLTMSALLALRTHLQRQLEYKSQLGDVWEDSYDLVFPNNRGGIMIPDHFVKRQFKRRMAEIHLPASIRFHDLRHTCATLLLSRGVNVKVVSEMLGHADISITLRVYAHVLPHMQQEAVNSMEDMLGEDITQF